MTTVFQQLNLEMSAIVEKARCSLVEITNGRRGLGAGTIWHSDGLILTNAHVIRGKSPQVTLRDNQKVPAKIVAYNAELDLAALAIEADNLPTIKLGNSKTLRPGELVLALGHPWSVKGAVSAGPVINVGLPPEISRAGQEFVQAGLQLRPGHSGGPMIDGFGRLVGINTLITGPEVGLAIPLHTVKEFLKHSLN